MTPQEALALPAAKKLLEEVIAGPDHAPHHPDYVTACFIWWRLPAIAEQAAQQERERLLERVEAEWYNGNVTESAYARILDPRPPSRRPGGRPNVCRTCGYHWLTDVADPVADHE